jgi:hypothetical protein
MVTQCCQNETAPISVFSALLSFVYIYIYCNSHHGILQVANE